MYPKPTIVNKQVLFKIQIPAKGWTSQKEAKLYIAFLSNRDTILGILFLAREDIKINIKKGIVDVPNILFIDIPSADDRFSISNRVLAMDALMDVFIEVSIVDKEDPVPIVTDRPSFVALPLSANNWIPTIINKEASKFKDQLLGEVS